MKSTPEARLMSALDHEQTSRHVRDEAQQAYAATLKAVPDDGPSMAFIKRIDSLATTPPDDGWDGSWHLDEK